VTGLSPEHLEHVMGIVGWGFFLGSGVPPRGTQLAARR